MKSKILYSIYFFVWTAFLILCSAYFTDKYYMTAMILIPVVGVFTLIISLTTFFTLLLLYIFKPLYRSKIKRVCFICSIPILPFILFVVATFIPNKLEEMEQTIEVSHISWACDCADWVKLDDIKRYDDNLGDTLATLSIFIEPADKSLELTDTLGYNGDILKLTGRYYIKKGFPKGYYSFEQPEKARIFRYTKYEIIKSNYRYSKKMSLNNQLLANLYQ